MLLLAYEAVGFNKVASYFLSLINLPPTLHVKPLPLCTNKPLAVSTRTCPIFNVKFSTMPFSYVVTRSWVSMYLQNPYFSWLTVSSPPLSPSPAPNYSFKLTISRIPPVYLHDQVRCAHWYNSDKTVHGDNFSSHWGSEPQPMHWVSCLWRLNFPWGLYNCNHVGHGGADL